MTPERQGAKVKSLRPALPGLLLLILLLPFLFFAGMAAADAMALPASPISSGRGGAAKEAAPPVLLGCRGRAAGDIYRLVLDLSAPVGDYKLEISGPSLRILLGGFASAGSGLPLPEDGFVRSLQANAGEGGLLLQVELAWRAPARAYRLPPAGAYPDRLVIDIRRIYEEKQERLLGELRVTDIYRGTEKGPLAVHLLSIPAGGNYRLQPIRAQGLETVSDMARRSGAMAAVNGGYFDRTGRPLGSLVIAGRREGYPLFRRSAIFIDSLGKVTLGNEDPGIEMFSLSQPEYWHCLGAGPRLVRAGKAAVASREESFRADIAEGRAPRTCLGLLADNSVLLMVADGRQPSHSIGMTLDEAAALMIRMGAVEAINLDGGGSSTLYIDGLLANSPSDGRERRVASALGIFSVPQSDDGEDDG